MVSFNRGSWLDLEIIDHQAAMFYERVTEDLSPVESHKTPTKYRNDFSQFLRSFVPVSENSFKRDNLRTKLIRAHKKILRILISHCKKYKYMLNGRFIPKKRFFRTRKLTKNTNKSILYMFDLNSCSDIDKLNKLVQIYSKDPNFFKCLAETGNGLKPDCKAQEETCLWKSVNTDYCRHYFSNELTRESFDAFLKLVFNNRTPEEYALRFNMKCCRDVVHDENCFGKWKELKKLLGMLNFWI